jgi:D-alanine-D-alanine ligase
VKRLRIGVIYGGRSGEHEVSLASAASVIANLDRRRYDPVPIRIDRDGRWALADRPPTAISAADVIEQARVDSTRPVRHGREVHLVAHPSDETILSIDRGRVSEASENDRALVTGVGLDIIFPVLHGPYGEDGTIQGLLELANVPYVGAGVLASAVGMDKAVMKLVFAARGLPIVDYDVLLARDWKADKKGIARRLADRLSFPMFVKPANLGSSVGISKVKEMAALSPALDLAAEFDRKLVVEAAVPHAREIECAVLGNDTPEASIPGEILPGREFYDYEAKYLDSSSTLLIPAPLPAKQAEDVRRLALEAFRAVDTAGMARVDFLLSGDTGPLYVNEINTIPGFTTISMFAKLWGATGVDYPSLLDRLVELAFERHAEKQQRRTSIS